MHRDEVGAQPPDRPQWLFCRGGGVDDYGRYGAMGSATFTHTPQGPAVISVSVAQQAKDPTTALSSLHNWPSVSVQGVNWSAIVEEEGQDQQRLSELLCQLEGRA